MKKTVLMLSVYDWANSGYKLHEAINRHSQKYEVHYFAINPHKFGYKRGETIQTNDPSGMRFRNHAAIARLAEINKKADIIHFKGDEGVIRKIESVKINLDKPIILTVCGTQWESAHDAIWDSCKEMVTKLCATTPDHLKYGKEAKFKSEVVTFAFDEVKYRPIPKSKDCIIIGQSPTSNRKGAELLENTYEKLRYKYPEKNIFINLQNNMNFYWTIEQKRLNHIFLDQINETGIYANSAVEAMAFGSATLASTDYGQPGIIPVHTMAQLELELERLIMNPEYLAEKQQDAYEYFFANHSYPVIANTMERIYDEVSC